MIRVNFGEIFQTKMLITGLLGIVIILLLVWRGRYKEDDKRQGAMAWCTSPPSGRKRYTSIRIDSGSDLAENCQWEITKENNTEIECDIEGCTLSLKAIQEREGKYSLAITGKDELVKKCCSMLQIENNTVINFADFTKRYLSDGKITSLHPVTKILYRHREICQSENLGIINKSMVKDLVVHVSTTEYDQHILAVTCSINSQQVTMNCRLSKARNGPQIILQGMMKNGVSCVKDKGFLSEIGCILKERDQDSYRAQIGSLIESIILFMVEKTTNMAKEKASVLSSMRGSRSQEQGQAI